MPDNLPPKASWPYGGIIPQRYSSNYQRYLQLGGLVEVAQDAAAYAGDAGIVDVNRMMFLSLAFDQIHKEGLQGEFAELGVYKGSTAAVLARYARRLNRRIFLMDTFEGFDQRDLKDAYAGGSILFGDTSLDAVRSRVGEANAVYLKGYFPETAAQLPDNCWYCLVHIDTDLYAPIMSGLEYFYPRMVPGGFMIVHDYGSLHWPGAERAVDTFFANKPECVIQIPDSAGSAIVRRLRPEGTGPTWIAKRQHLAQGVWHSAGNGHLSILLSEGWSGIEPWGVWGVGPVHRITLNTGAAAADKVVVDLDVHAFLWNELVGREVDVLVNGQHACVLLFTSEANRRTHSLSHTRTVGDNGSLTIELCPRIVPLVKDIFPGKKDARPLGVALHRIRVRSVGAI